MWSLALTITVKFKHHDLEILGAKWLLDSYDLWYKQGTEAVGTKTKLEFGFQTDINLFEFVVGDIVITWVTTRSPKPREYESITYIAEFPT